TAMYSAIKELPVDNKVAMTGEVSIRGEVRPVGGIVAKVEAARQAGVKKVFIPKDNWQDLFARMKDILVVPVERLEEVIHGAILAEPSPAAGESFRIGTELLSAMGSAGLKVSHQ